MPKLTVDQRLQGIEGLTFKRLNSTLLSLHDTEGALAFLRRFEGRWYLALLESREYPPEPMPPLSRDFAWTEDEEAALKRLLTKVLGEEVR